MGPVGIPLPRIPISLPVAFLTTSSPPMSSLIPLAFPIPGSGPGWGPGPSPVSTGLVRLVFVYLHLYVVLRDLALDRISVVGSIIVGSRAWSGAFAGIRMRVEGGGVRGRRLRQSRFLVRSRTRWWWFNYATTCRRTRRNTVAHLWGRVRVVMGVCVTAI